MPDRSQLAAELRVACMRIARQARSEAGGLAPQHVSALVPLEKQPRTASWLAEREQVSNASMSRTVKELTELGLITRTPHPDDGRQRVLTITDAGRAQLAEARTRRTSWMCQQLEGCTDDELELLRAATPVLVRLSESGRCR